MADEADLQVSEQGTSVEKTTVDSQSQEQTDDSNQTSTEQQVENQEGKTDEGQTDTASTGDQKQSENQDFKQDSKPLSRRSAKYRIQELTRKVKELESQKKPQVEQDDWEETPQEDDKPDIASLVAKEVEKRLNPVISESTKAADDAELSELFSGDKAVERTKYEPAIRDMWKLPQYKDVAATDLYKIASFNEAVANATAKAIEEYKKAEKEAKESSASGTSNSNRTGKGGKSVNDMTDEEFRQHNERVKAGQA